MGEIQLTRGLCTIVDSDLLEWLNQWNWQAHRQRNSDYAIRTERRDGKRYFIYMHRAIVKYDGYNIYHKQVDHADTDGLNNQRYNLRIATPGQNSHNTRKPSNNASGYKGVYWNKADKVWVAQIGVDNRRFYLGGFPCPIEAARAYDNAARQYFGVFALLNFPISA